MPVTPITDMKIHRNDLVLSTMGRSFWILDNIAPLRSYGNFLSQQPLLDITDTYRFRYRSYSDDHVSYPSSAVDFDYLISHDDVENVKISVYDSEGQMVNSYSSTKTEQEINNYVMSTSTFVIRTKREAF